MRQSAGKSNPHGEEAGKVVAIDKRTKCPRCQSAFADEALPDTDKGDQSTDR
jgi:hypothetical protein